MCIFLAIDSVPHSALMDKLQHLIQDEHILVGFAGSYLLYWKEAESSHQWASINHNTCSLLSPTGICTGPLLFLIYIDGVMDWHASLSAESAMCLY